MVDKNHVAIISYRHAHARHAGRRDSIPPATGKQKQQYVRTQSVEWECHYCACMTPHTLHDTLVALLGGGSAYQVSKPVSVELEHGHLHAVLVLALSLLQNAKELQHRAGRHPRGSIALARSGINSAADPTGPEHRVGLAGTGLRGSGRR